MSASQSQLRLRSVDSEIEPALGFIELSSISRGLLLTDAVLKKAPIRVIASQPISSGKHVLLFMGDVASVEESMKEALGLASTHLIRSVVIPAVHVELMPFLDSLWNFSPKVSSIGESLGMIESTTLSGAILAADHTLKTADVHLVRMRLGQGIGGKAYFLISGKQADVEAGCEAARNSLQESASLCEIDLIARPNEESLNYF